MSLPISRCRGFTNPVILLVRASLESPTITTPIQHLRIGGRWNISSTRCLTTGHILRAAQPNLNAKATKAVPAATRTIPKSRPPRSSPASPPASPTPRPLPARSTPPPPPSRTPPPTSDLAKTLDSLPQIGYAQSLARKGGVPTILYESAPQRLFLTSSYLAGLFGVLAGGVNVYFNVYNPPDGTSPYVVYCFAAVGFCMAALGTRFALMPAGVVRSISVLPPTSTNAAAATPSLASRVKAALTGTGTAKSTTTTTTPPSSTSPRVQLEIKVRRFTPLPFLPLKRLRVSPGDVVMKARLYNAPPAGAAAQKTAAERRAEEARRKAARQYELDHIMTAPFRDGARAAGTVMAGIRRGITGEGFAPLIVNGVKYKLDITSAYALDEGRALDRVVRIEEDASLHRLASRLFKRE